MSTQKDKAATAYNVTLGIALAMLTLGGMAGISSIPWSSLTTTQIAVGCGAAWLLACGFLARNIAPHGREVAGFLLGLILGPIGVFVAGLLAIANAIKNEPPSGPA